MEASDPVFAPEVLTPTAQFQTPTLRRRLVALGEVILCSSVPTQLALGAILHALGMSAVGPDGALSRNFVVILSVADTVLLIFFMVWLTREEGERPSVLWLGTRPWRRETVFGLSIVPLLVIGVGVLLNAIRLFAPSLRNVPTNPLEQLASNPSDAAVLAVVAIVAGGVREELQRAFLLRRFERYLGGTSVGIVVLSLAFGLGHFVQGWDAVITTGVLGAVWAWIYVWRRSSVAPVVSHAAFNSLEIVRVALVGLS